MLIAFNLGFVAYNAWAVMAQVFFGRPFDWFLEAVLFLIFGVVDYLFVRSGEGHIAA